MDADEILVLLTNIFFNSCEMKFLLYFLFQLEHDSYETPSFSWLRLFGALKNLLKKDLLKRKEG